MRVTLVIARARNGVIGRDNALPWHLPEDLRHFKALTTGYPIIMGRRTWESIGRPLPGRRTIVITRDPSRLPSGIESSTSLRDAIARAGTPGPDPAISTDEVFIVGGAEIYRQAMAQSLVDRAIITEIDLEPAGDVHLDPPCAPQWRRVSSTGHRSASGIAFRIDEWLREAHGPADSAGGAGI
jgi:dihydrofolate reductase